MATHPDDKIAKLPQTDALWQAAVRLAPAWIASENQPRYRPYVMFVLDAQNDTVRQVQMTDERPAPEEVFSVLLAAMSKPAKGSGKRSRPANIVLNDEDFVRELAPRLAEIGVRCDYQASLPMIDTLLRELSAHLNQGEKRAALQDVPGITQSLIAEFYAAAVYFYQQAPWRWVDNLAAMAVRYPPDGPVCYAVIMGFGGQEFGVAIFPTLEDLRLQYTGLEPDELLEKMSGLSVTYGEDDMLAFEDLDAITQHGWPVAAPNAYPLVMKTRPPGELTVPSSAEIALLAAALRTLPDFVANHLLADGTVQPEAEAVFRLPNVHANQQIAYRYPVDLPELTAIRQGTAFDEVELEHMIEQWFWDKPSHAFARQVGALLMEFLNYLAWTGLSQQTLRKHERNCWLIGKFTCDYGSAQPFSPRFFLGGPSYLAEFRRKVSSSPAALASYQATWRKLERYIRDQGYA